MKDEDKTREQLLSELKGLRQRILFLDEELAACRAAENVTTEPRERSLPRREAPLSPPGDLDEGDFTHYMDFRSIQDLMDSFYKVTHIGVGILDLKGNVLVATGWQDICTKFHRVHPEALKNCITSDLFMSGHLERGKYSLYKCKNNMWDMATPIVAGDRPIAYLYLGQFFFEDEVPDYAIFVDQARKYGFDEREYLAALERVPRWSRETVHNVMEFYTKFADLVSSLSFANLELERSLLEHKRAEEALKKAERQYRSIFENAVEGIFQATPEGRYLSVNPALAAMCGYRSPEEMIETVTNIQTQLYLNPDDRGKIKALYEELGIVRNFEAQFKRTDGRKIWVSVNARAVRDELGNMLFYEGTIEDITERKEAEEALRERERTWATLLSNLPGFVYRCANDRDWTMEYISEGCRDITGYGPEDFIEKRTLVFNDLIHPDYRESLWQKWQDLLARRETFEDEYPIVTANGETRWVWERGRGIYAEDGRLLYLEGFITDTTERKQAQETIGRMAERFRIMLGAQHYGIVVVDENDRIEYINEAFCELFGLTKDPTTWIGCRADDFLAMILPAYADSLSVLRLVHNIVAKGEPVVGEEVLTQDGRTYLVDFTPIVVMGRPAGRMWQHRDITERKKTEEERRRLEERLRRAEKMEALGTLAGGVAHDLNNVLGIVVGYSELLLDDLGESSPARSKALGILKGGQRAAAIVQDLLTLARRGVPARKVVNLNSIVMESRNSPELVRILSSCPNLEMKMDLDPGLLNVCGSPIHLEKSFMNLVSNAVEAMPSGGVITVRTGNEYLDKPISGYDEVREGDYVVLSVSDTGEGISPADLKRIFEPFYTKKIMGRSGSGLGLAVVWGTVKDHLGYINVESEEGKGTTFTLYFPVTREEPPDEQAGVSASEFMGKGESILVVDDVQEQRDLASTMLRKLNYSVEAVSSGEEALEYIKHHPVDLVILDMIMEPGMDGLDTYREMLAIHPHQRAIIVSGFAETERVAEAQSLGAGRYLRKPYLIEKLGMAVRRELEKPLRETQDAGH